MFDYRNRPAQASSLPQRAFSLSQSTKSGLLQRLCPRAAVARPHAKSRLKARGFTLIELIVVIVILGILAATAIPKYMSMRREARIAALHGMEGAIRDAIAMAQGAYAISNTYPDDWPEAQKCFFTEYPNIGMTTSECRGKTIRKTTSETVIPMRVNGQTISLAVTAAAAAGITPGTPLAGQGSPEAMVYHGIGRILNFDCTKPSSPSSGALLYTCNGWSVLQYHTNALNGDDQSAKGMYVFPSGAEPPSTDWSGIVLNNLQPTGSRCFVKYATAFGASSKPNNENEPIVLYTRTEDC